MSLFRRGKTAFRVLRNEGVAGIVSLLISKFGSPKSRWRVNTTSEREFWDSYFQTKGLEWAASYQTRFDPDLPLQERAAALLPPEESVHILDVGAGPLTCLGKRAEGKRLTITAVDPLADEYDKILKKHGIQPLVRTRKLAAEELTQAFPVNTYDLVFARNCIGHSYNPERAILEMINVVKRGRYVLLEHLPNEGKSENYQGLHQWNFSSSKEGDFLISSRRKGVNMTKRYAHLCTITCDIVNTGKGGDWLITRILKK